MVEIIVKEINCSTDESYPTSEIQSNLENPISVSDIKNGKSFKYALTPADNGNDLSCSGLVPSVTSHATSVNLKSRTAHVR